MEVFIQELTLARTVLDLRTDLFAHAQLYTALSRVSQRHQPLATIPTPPLRPKKTICIARRQFLVRMKENSLTYAACSCRDVAFCEWDVRFGVRGIRAVKEVPGWLWICMGKPRGTRGRTRTRTPAKTRTRCEGTGFLRVSNSQTRTRTPRGFTRGYLR